jgi:sugar O-acyltransferase (sialic acid O-acetyltransferase NeuD family)
MSKNSQLISIISRKKLLKFNNRLVIFGSQSESLSDFYDLAKKLNYKPVCVDNLDEKILTAKHECISYKKLQKFYFGLPIVISVISPDKRALAALHAKNLGFEFFSAFINPSSDVSSSAKISEGVFVNSSAVIGSNTVLANFVTINNGANVAHDVTINEFTHVAPSACILGSVKIGSRVLIGANATILPKLTIGDGAVIGAGAVVTHDVLSGQVVYGNPASEH